MLAQTIDEVIASLNDIIDDCSQQNSRLGYFPAMYRKVTLRVDEGIRRNRFEDNRRMEWLDVVFANRYLEAFQLYNAGKRPTRSWALAFEMAKASRSIVIQHLLLGMNAHINLDLGIAAAEVCRGQELESLRNDFFAINELLAGLFDEVQNDINKSSPVLHALDQLGWGADEALGNFSIRQARRSAWDKAHELHRLPDDEWDERIESYDQEVAQFASVLCSPFRIINVLTETINDSETKEPYQIIEELRQ
jgi:hypothetical protein